MLERRPRARPPSAGSKPKHSRCPPRGLRPSPEGELRSQIPMLPSRAKFMALCLSFLICKQGREGEWTLSSYYVPGSVRSAFCVRSPQHRHPACPIVQMWTLRPEGQRRCPGLPGFRALIHKHHTTLGLSPTPHTASGEEMSRSEHCWRIISTHQSSSYCCF